MICCRHEWARRSLERRPFLLSAFTNQKDRTTHCVTTHSVDCSRHSRCVPSPLQLYEPSSFCVPPQCRWPCLTLASQTTKARLASCTGPSCRTWYGPSSSRSGRASLASASSFAGTSGTRRCGEDKYDAWKSVSAVDMRVATSGTTERSRCDKRTGLPESASVVFTVFLLLVLYQDCKFRRISLPLPSELRQGVPSVGRYGTVPFRVSEYLCRELFPQFRAMPECVQRHEESRRTSFPIL